VAGQSLDVFIAGDDADAKATVAKLAGDGGLDPIDAAPLNAAVAVDARLAIPDQHLRQPPSRVRQPAIPASRSSVSLLKIRTPAPARE
jgi:predicted dinucleotide-binding enzyme